MTLVTPGTDSLPTGKYGSFKTLIHNVNKSCVGISIRFGTVGYGIFAGQEALPLQLDTSTLSWALVRYITVLGKPAGGKLVKLTNDETLTGGYLYDPAAEAKYNDANFGLPIVKITEDLGEVTDSIAEAVGRAELKALLDRGPTREYEFDAELATLPLPFQTIDMADGFSGVCVETRLSMRAGKETVIVTLVDLS